MCKPLIECPARTRRSEGARGQTMERASSELHTRSLSSPPCVVVFVVWEKKKKKKQHATIGLGWRL